MAPENLLILFYVIKQIHLYLTPLKNELLRLHYIQFYIHVIVPNNNYHNDFLGLGYGAYSKIPMYFPMKIIHWAKPINIGNEINITLFNPDTKYTFSANNILSKSKNSIFENQDLKGKVYGIISNNQISLN